MFTRVFRIGLLVLGAGVVFNIHDADELIAFYDNGHGPLSELPLWVQALLFLVVSDFMLYWLHRMFHRRRLLEVSRDPSFLRGTGLDFRGALSSGQPVHRNDHGRRHPADGGHFAQHHAVGRAVHDLPLRLRPRQPELDVGPFKYVLATPVFHRWHHTSLDKGGNTNFAGTFPLWDIMFGTFRMPENQLPDHYGVDDQASRPKSADSWPIRSANSIPGQGA